MIRRLALRSTASFALVAALAAGCSPAAPAAAPPRAPAAASSGVTNAALAKLFDDYWQNALKEDPTTASQLGDKRYNDRWPDASPAGFERRHHQRVDFVTRLHAIPRAPLSTDDRLNYDLFERMLGLEIEGWAFGLHRLVLNQREGIQTQTTLVQELSFETVKDYEDWIARLHAFPAYMDGTLATLREGIQTRIVHPRIVMERVPAQIDKHLVPADKSGFWKPFDAMPASFSPADRERLTRAGKKAIDDDVVPSFRRMKDFLTKEYLPACYPEVGAWQLPRGAELYAFTARLHTTTSMTPQAIHETGLREVARIKAEMLGVMGKVGFKGTLPEFFTMLRTDPRFFYRTPEELLAGYRAIAKTIDPKLVKLFKTIPRTPYGVEAIEATAAPDTTTGYYGRPAEDGSRAGTYYVNLYKPEARPKWEMMALSLHESVPGHHLQIALALEHGAVPDFRRDIGWSAFVEGWGLYAESLGAEVGLYEDPYSKFGQLTYEMWRAVRLVVDTGIHHLKWDRKKAIDYFMENAAKQELDVVNEVDRYIAWPGQALAYKIGELKIKELRARAEKALGTRFDVRTFHDAVLEQGAVPLDVLERHIDEWIAKQKP
jgi:prolyl oligopeptidase